MKKIRTFAVLCGVIVAGATLVTGCSLFGGGGAEPSEPTYNINYFNYLESGDSLPYGSEINNENETYYKSSEGLVLEPATCTGWVFDGWFEGVYWSTPQTLCWDDAVLLNQIEIGRTENINLYGKWHRGEFEITFDAGEGEFLGGVKTKSLNFAFEDDVIVSSLEVPTRDCYDFYEWTDLPEKMPAENLTIYASWSKRYAVNYVLNTDESLQTSEIAWTWQNSTDNPTEYSQASDIYLKSATTTRPGYAFDYWCLDSGLNQSLGNLKNIPEGSEEITLYAKWSPIFTSLDSGTINSLNALGRRQKEIRLPNKYIDDNGNLKSITHIGGGGSSIFSATIGYTPSQIEKVVIDEGITYIAARSFYENRVLKEVVLPSTITSFGNSAFEGCTNLSSLNLCDTFGSLTNIGSSVFTGGSIGFEKVSFPEQLATVGSYAFLGCAIQEIEIYSSTNVGGLAFGYNFELEKVTIKQAESQTSIWVDTNAFMIGFDDNIGNFEVIIDSVYAYASSNATVMAGGNYYGYISLAKVVKVKKDFVDNIIKAQEDRDNTNTFLNDESKFTKTSEGDYYVYTRVEQNQE